MNGLKRASATLVVVLGISLGIGISPVIPAVTSGGHPASPDVFHCC